MREGQIHSLKYLEENRKKLRKRVTPAEVRLWQALQGKKLLGCKFRRQHTVLGGELVKRSPHFLESQFLIGVLPKTQLSKQI